MAEKSKEMRGMFLQLGNNMWSDVPVKDWALTKKEDLADVSSLDVLRFDEAVWRRLTNHEGTDPARFLRDSPARLRP